MSACQSYYSGKRTAGRFGLLLLTVLGIVCLLPALSLSAVIDSRVLEDTAGERTAGFLVRMKAMSPLAAPDGRAGISTVAEKQRQAMLLRDTAEVSQREIRAELRKMKVPHRAFWITNVLAVTGDRALVELLAARTDVEEIESDRAIKIDLESLSPSPLPAAPAGVEWNIAKVNAPYVWNLGFTGQGLIYANADTGVQWDHPALKQTYAGWNGSSADHNYVWWDAIHEDISGNGSNPCGFNSPLPCDDGGHGTGTMGIGVGDDRAGNQIGVAPGATWIACRNMDEGVGRPSTYIECLEFFYAPTDLNKQNPDVSRRPHAVGNSYHCPPAELCTSHSLQSAVEALRSAGVFMAVSAGNTGYCSAIGVPGIEAAVFTVGATNAADSIWIGSSRGPVTVDGKILRKPDLVAPGEGVRSSFSGAAYTSGSGTSFAAPHVAGGVLLLWSAFPVLQRDIEATQALLELTALHQTSTQGCGGDAVTDVPNNVYGFGRLDLKAAYDYMQAGGSSPRILVTTQRGTDGGSGNILSGDGLVQCSSVCFYVYPAGSPLALTAVPGVDAYFYDGWSGCASTLGFSCSLVLDKNREIVASFTSWPPVALWSNGDPFQSVGAAYETVTFPGDIVRIQGVSLVETLSLARPVEVTLGGGYDRTFSNNVLQTKLIGSLTIKAGTVTLDRISFE